MRNVLLTIVLLTTAPAAFAYIGPGAGISLVSSVLGILGAIFLGFFAILAWPIRRMLKRRKAEREKAGNTQVAGESGNSTPPDTQD